MFIVLAFEKLKLKYPYLRLNASCVIKSKRKRRLFIIFASFPSCNNTDWAPGLELIMFDSWTQNNYKFPTEFEIIHIRLLLHTFRRIYCFAEPNIMNTNNYHKHYVQHGTIKEKKRCLDDKNCQYYFSLLLKHHIVQAG